MYSTIQTAEIIPAYFNPSSALFQQIITQKQANPTAIIGVILNPSNGPGTAKNATYASLVAQLDSTGIIMFGYVATGWGTRAMSAIQTDIQRWHSFYPEIEGKGGLFFDEMGNTGSVLAFYQQVQAYAASQGFEKNIGNPGASVDPILINCFSSLCLWETRGVPPSLQSQGQAYIADSIASLPSSIPFAGNAQWVYLTTEPDPPTYQVLPTYQLAEVEALVPPPPPVEPSPPPVIPPPVTPPPHPATVTLMVTGQDASGNTEDGYFVTAASASEVLAGFTPASFIVDENTTYQVTVDGYEDEEFASWEVDGSTANPRTVNVGVVNVSLVAIFQPAVIVTPPPPPTTAPLTITAADQDGGPLGMFQQVAPPPPTGPASGSTPSVFTLVVGNAYQVYPNNYTTYTFSHWNDLPATDKDYAANPRTVTITEATTIEAAYQNSALVRPPPPPPPPPATYSMTVNAKVGSKALLGYFVSLQQGGAQIQSAFTSAKFAGLAPGPYVVIPTSSFGGYAFEKWADGSTKLDRTVNLTKNVTMTAIYIKQPSTT